MNPSRYSKQLNRLSITSDADLVKKKKETYDFYTIYSTFLRKPVYDAFPCNSASAIIHTLNHKLGNRVVQFVTSIMT